MESRHNLLSGTADMDGIVLRRDSHLRTSRANTPVYACIRVRCSCQRASAGRRRTAKS